MPSIPSILALPKAQDLFDEQGEPRADWVALQARRFLDELEWYADALKAARAGASRTETAPGLDVQKLPRAILTRRARSSTTSQSGGNPSASEWVTKSIVGTTSDGWVGRPASPGSSVARSRVYCTSPGGE